MVTVTESAGKKLEEIFANKEKTENKVLRVSLGGFG